jgi:hypothetical protein
VQDREPLQVPGVTPGDSYGRLEPRRRQPGGTTSIHWCGGPIRPGIREEVTSHQAEGLHAAPEQDQRGKEEGAGAERDRQRTQADPATERTRSVDVLSPSPSSEYS